MRPRPAEYESPRQALMLAWTVRPCDCIDCVVRGDHADAIVDSKSRCYTLLNFRLDDALLHLFQHDSFLIHARDRFLIEDIKQHYLFMYHYCRLINTAQDDSVEFIIGSSP